MATVHFSEKLRSEITNKCKNIYDKKTEALRDSFPQSFALELTKAMMEPYSSLMNQLPRQFFVKKNQIYLESVNKYTVDNTTSLTTEVLWPTIDSSDFRDMFPGVQDAYTYRAELLHLRVPEIEVVFNKYPQLNIYRPEIYKWIDDSQKLTNEREAFIRGVENVITSYRTLGPALKAWPPLWDLIPEEAQQRHKQIASRARATPDEIDADLNALTSVVVAHKLGA